MMCRADDAINAIVHLRIIPSTKRCLMWFV